MSPLQPVALFGLEVPPGDILVPVSQSFPATVRITMAAIDPTEEVEEDADVPRRPRSTLKLVKQSIGDLDAESDEDDEYLRDLLLGGGDDDEDESEDDDDETNGGPSDPSKSKKTLQAAALKELLDATKDEEDSDEEMADAASGKKKGKKADATKAANAKGKAKAVEVEEEESEDEDDELAGLDLEQFVVCTLDTEAHYQQPLELTIGEEEKAFFVNSGTHTIYVTGNYVINEDQASDSEEEDSDDDDYDLPPELDELVGDESEDELDDIDGAGRVEEIDTDEEVPKLVEAKKGKNKRAAEDAAEGLDELIAKEDTKLSKKQAKKLKNNEGKAVAAEKETPKSEKKVQFAKNLEQGPTGSPAAEKGKKAAATGGVKVVQGVKIDDRKAGAGRTAKSGDKVGMRYIGKLDNGKVFDSNKKGAPFSFKLGKGEVIKGWDIGVAGMAVGGERRLTIPAHLAYGSKGVPGIPPNSTLTFDVKLLEIK
ncbi:hypothetical protein diail_9318 [Diaporthe ilicicola]|nr:hypothetical protein diail_9318 [Diaporthe ilicicola]